MKIKPIGDSVIEFRLTDYIKIYHNKLDHTICDTIVNEYQDCNDWIPGCVGEHSKIIDYTKRNCDVISITQDNIISKNPSIRKDIDTCLYNTINKSFNEYLLNFPAGCLNISADTGYTLLRYKKDQYITQHVDASTDISRIISCSIGINSGYTGGEFSFFDRQLKFPLDKGDILFFPSNFLYPHEVLPVTSGVRYSILTWLF